MCSISLSRDWAVPSLLVFPIIRSWPCEAKHEWFMQLAHKSTPCKIKIWIRRDESSSLLTRSPTSRNVYHFYPFIHPRDDPAPSSEQARLEVSLAPPPSAIFRHRSLLSPSPPFTCAFTQVTLTHAAAAAAATKGPNSRRLSPRSRSLVAGEARSKRFRFPP